MNLSRLIQLGRNYILEYIYISYVLWYILYAYGCLWYIYTFPWLGPADLANVFVLLSAAARYGEAKHAPREYKVDDDDDDDDDARLMPKTTMMRTTTLTTMLIRRGFFNHGIKLGVQWATAQMTSYAINDNRRFMFVFISWGCMRAISLAPLTTRAISWDFWQIWFYIFRTVLILYIIWCPRGSPVKRRLIIIILIIVINF